MFGCLGFGHEKIPPYLYDMTVFSGSAERAGFEPANLCGLHAFQACALSQTTRPLHLSSGKIIPEFKSSFAEYALQRFDRDSQAPANNLHKAHA